MSVDHFQRHRHAKPDISHHSSSARSQRKARRNGEAFPIIDLNQRLNRQSLVDHPGNLAGHQHQPAHLHRLNLQVQTTLCQPASRLRFRTACCIDGFHLLITTLSNLPHPVHDCTCTSWDQATNDHVLLQTLQGVTLTVHRRFVRTRVSPGTTLPK